MDFDYDTTLTSDERSRSRLQIAAAYANVAMRAGLTIDELQKCTIGPINEARARAFAVMMNLAFALEVAMKGKIPDEILATIKPNSEKHNLRMLFDKLPKAEQNQMKTMVTDILVISVSTFDEYLDLCKNGFKEWRYFFEPDKAGKEYNYLGVTVFLYAAVYYLITSEQSGSLLEPSHFKRQCYVGEWGFLRTKYKLVKKYRDAEKIALEEGHGIISESDRKWLQSIRERQDEISAEIRRTEKKYFQENAMDESPIGYISLSPSP